MADDPRPTVGERVEPLADQPVEAPVRASERVFEGKVWDIRRDAFEFGGEEIVREYVDHTGAVGVLAIDDADRVFLIKQYRHPVRMRDWEIPAGLLDVDGEHPLAAAQRELAEEADLEASDWAVLADVATSPGGSDEVIRIYVARDLSATASVFAREAEEADMQTRWVPLAEGVEAVLARRIHNAPLAIALLAADAARARGWQSLGEADAPWPNRAPTRQDPTAP
ncbi:NUDIX domain-containing protein [Agromyces ramosus]|uniref:8-oxo-dGTP pyrophosphatase MutT (NUDIX family) n=1 Tax=Agromyces ramosus TaxID=33879 RepID=A0ABU0RCG6_9MICO|nr:NUDIX hydrolase [Agromyces ramosus]MDQ0895763.1 8-oxo-dGTP pyrophosphatase MutT (NUDIX family) [Agromyces ramosus]